jgi:hypothetical protein
MTMDGGSEREPCRGQGSAGHGTAILPIPPPRGLDPGRRTGGGTGRHRLRPLRDRGRGPQAYYQTAFPGHDVSGHLEEAFRAVKRIRVTGSTTTIGSPRRRHPWKGIPWDRRPGPGRGHLHQLHLPGGFRCTDRQSRPEGHPPDEPPCHPLPRHRGRVCRDGRSDTSRTAGAPAHRPNLGQEGPVQPGHGPGRNPTLRHPGPGRPERPGPHRGLLPDGNRGPGPLRPPGAGGRCGPALLGILRLRSGASRRVSHGDPGHRERSRREATASFLIDGLWNEGISGGPILAVRGQDGSLEWVGIARAAAGRLEHRLTPDPESIQALDQRQLYEGRIYLEEIQRILYGISLSVPMTTIREFINRNRADLRRRGWEVPRF